jgi:tetrahydromethanopterin S-methyltransferase subunit B
MNDTYKAAFFYGLVIGLAAIAVYAVVLSNGGCQP